VRALLVAVALLATGAAHAGPLTASVETPLPAWYVPSAPPKPDGCECTERFDAQGRRLTEAPAECIDWLFLRAAEATESGRQLVVVQQFVEVVVPALDGIANLRGEAIKEARSNRVRDVLGTNLATNTGSLFIGGFLGFGVCNAAN